MTTFGYLRPKPGEAPPFQGDEWSSPAARAIAAYGEASGAGKLSWRVETDLARPSRIADRTVGAQLLRELRDGDTLLVHTVADLCDLPSDLDQLVKALSGRGVVLEVTSLAHGGHAKVVRDCIEAFAGLEAELDRAIEERDSTQRVADERLDHSVRVAMKQLIENYGIPAALKLGRSR